MAGPLGGDGARSARRVVRAVFLARRLRHRQADGCRQAAGFRGFLRRQLRRLAAAAATVGRFARAAAARLPTR